MALTDPVLPYGLRDVKLTPINADGSFGTSVDLPVAQTLTFSEAEEYEELRGDDKLVATHGKGAQVEWELEAGGISMAAWKVLSGGTITDSGSGTTEVREYLKKVTDARQYFKIEGQSVADAGGDVHVVIYKAKCDENLEGEFSDGTFFVSSCSGKGLGDASDNLYKFTYNETQTAIAATNNEIQEIVIDATGGNFTLTYAGQTTANNPVASATAGTIQTALEALSNLAPGDIIVTGAVGGPFRVEFAGTLAGTNVAQMTATGVSLTGGSSSVTIHTIRQGG